jgi:hypothetical protein
MPSPEHAADLERVLTRAAAECASASAWFGEGLPRDLERALEAAGERCPSGSPEVAFVDAATLSSASPPKATARRIVALSDASLDQLRKLVHHAESSSLPITRLICPFAVFDFTREGLRVREIRQGLTAADLQRRLDAPLWAGPDLKQL